MSSKLEASMRKKSTLAIAKKKTTLGIDEDANPNSLKKPSSR